MKSNVFHQIKKKYWYSLQLGAKYGIKTMKKNRETLLKCCGSLDIECIINFFSRNHNKIEMIRLSEFFLLEDEDKFN